MAGATKSSLSTTKLATKKRISKASKSSITSLEKYVKPAVGIAVAIFAYYFLKGLKEDIPRIDVTDEYALREVFFGEQRDTIQTSSSSSSSSSKKKTYVVLCHSDQDTKSASKIGISSVFHEAKTTAYKELADFVLMDCTHVLPSSGETIYQRFSLDSKIRPTIFVSSKKLSPPKQISAEYLKSGNVLLKYLRSIIEPHPIKLSSTKVLKNSCLDSDYCAVLIKGTTPVPQLKSSIQSLIEHYEEREENIQFASLDGLTLAMTNLEEHLPLVKKGENQFLLFKKVSGGLKQKTDSRLITSFSSYNSQEYSFDAMNSYLVKQMSSNQFTKLISLPSIATRTKKLENQMISKRDRILEQRQRAFDKQQEKIKEPDRKAERRADRERLREEHMKANNIKPKTPEEIAERERARRQRMEEEAAKWNIMQEDEYEEEEEASQNINVEDNQDEYIQDFDEEEFDEDEDIIDVDLDLD